MTAHKAFYKSRATDARIAATMKNVQAGALTPGIPQMGKFWAAMESALSSISGGRQRPKEALDAAAARIKM